MQKRHCFVFCLATSQRQILIEHSKTLLQIAQRDETCVGVSAEQAAVEGAAKSNERQQRKQQVSSRTRFTLAPLFLRMLRLLLRVATFSIAVEELERLMQLTGIDVHASLRIPTHSAGCNSNSALIAAASSSGGRATSSAFRCTLRLVRCGGSSAVLLLVRHRCEKRSSGCEVRNSGRKSGATGARESRRGWEAVKLCREMQGNEVRSMRRSIFFFVFSSLWHSQRLWRILTHQGIDLEENKLVHWTRNSIISLAYMKLSQMMLIGRAAARRTCRNKTRRKEKALLHLK